MRKTHARILYHIRMKNTHFCQINNGKRFRKSPLTRFFRKRLLIFSRPGPPGHADGTPPFSLTAVKWLHLKTDLHPPVMNRNGNRPHLHFPQLTDPIYRFFCVIFRI